jgi:hypothetical protein
MPTQRCSRASKDKSSRPGEFTKLVADLPRQLAIKRQVPGECVHQQFGDEADIGSTYLLHLGRHRQNDKHGILLIAVRHAR